MIKDNKKKGVCIIYAKIEYYCTCLSGEGIS